VLYGKLDDATFPKLTCFNCSPLARL